MMLSRGLLPRGAMKSGREGGGGGGIPGLEALHDVQMGKGREGGGRRGPMRMGMLGLGEECRGTASKGPGCACGYACGYEERLCRRKRLPGAPLTTQIPKDQFRFVCFYPPHVEPDSREDLLGLEAHEVRVERFHLLEERRFPGFVDSEDEDMQLVLLEAVLHEPGNQPKHVGRLKQMPQPSSARPAGFLCGRMYVSLSCCSSIGPRSCRLPLQGACLLNQADLWARSGLPRTTGSPLDGSTTSCSALSIHQYSS